MLKLLKNKGILIFDPDGDMDEPITAFLYPEYESSLHTNFLSYEYKIEQFKNSKQRSTTQCSITIKSNTKEKVNKIANNLKDIFTKIGNLGNGGHSFDILFIPKNKHAKEHTISLYGDESDYIDIKSIKIK